MNMKILFTVLACMAPVMANAAMPYRAQIVRAPASVGNDGNDDQAFAARRRFYIGGMYDFSMWSSYTDDNNVHVDGKNTSSFDVMAGVRVNDFFRIEANYIRTRAKYDNFSLDGNAGFLNAIVDARIDSLYRLFYTQRLVPYVGVGAGVVSNSAHDAHIDNKVTPGLAAMAGLGIELGDRFTIDLGYRYMYMFTPKFDEISDLNPTAHQLRAGARFNF